MIIPRTKNDETEGERWNMLGRKEKATQQVKQTIQVEEGNDKRRKTKKISKRDKTT